jgi:hypothetical protein
MQISTLRRRIEEGRAVPRKEVRSLDIGRIRELLKLAQSVGKPRLINRIQAAISWKIRNSRKPKKKIPRGDNRRRKRDSKTAKRSDYGLLNSWQISASRNKNTLLANRRARMVRGGLPSLGKTSH